MNRLFKILVISCLVFVPYVSNADMIPMKDFIYLNRGMSEAEVLYRVGPYDHETVVFDYHNNILKKTWYYIPVRNTSNAWITEITFNGSGIIQSLDRYRSYR